MPLLSRLRGSVSARALRFGAVGLSGVFVNLACVQALVVVLGWPRLVGLPAAIEVSILTNFLLNDAWTFRDRTEGAAAGFWARLGRYNLVALVGLAIQVVIAETAARGLETAGWKPLGAGIHVAALAGIAAATGWNFVSSLRFTWAQRTTHESEVVP
ncbi:MAG: GtrA family protein [Myxococcota bacterium]